MVKFHRHPKWLLFWPIAALLCSLIVILDSAVSRAYIKIKGVPNLTLGSMTMWMGFLMTLLFVVCGTVQIVYGFKNRSSFAKTVGSLTIAGSVLHFFPFSFLFSSFGEIIHRHHGYGSLDFYGSAYFFALILVLGITIGGLKPIKSH